MKIEITIDISDEDNGKQSELLCKTLDLLRQASEPRNEETEKEVWNEQG